MDEPVFDTGIPLSYYQSVIPPPLLSIGIDRLAVLSKIADNPQFDSIVAKYNDRGQGLQFLDKLADLTERYKRVTDEDKKREKLELVDITNFINNYNFFMYTATTICNLFIEKSNKYFFTDLQMVKYEQLAPEERLFPHDDNLKQFQKSMKNKIDLIYDRVLYFLNLPQIEIFIIK